MKRINKTAEDQFLIDFKELYPQGTWDDFRDYERGNLYKNLKKHICNDQYYLCAYCEIDLDRDKEHEIRIEHFKSKSGSNNQVGNWHLDWLNLLGVCLGGSNLGDDFALPANLSCDAHKSCYEDKNNVNDKDWSGKILLPLTIPEGHNFFIFDKATGMLLANDTYCNSVSIDGSAPSSTVEIVNKTIEVFNLNCNRLNKARLRILHYLNSCAKDKDLRKLHKLTLQWSQGESKFFQTTRDILLRENKICQGLLNGTITF